MQPRFRFVMCDNQEEYVHGHIVGVVKSIQSSAIPSKAFGRKALSLLFELGYISVADMNYLWHHIMHSLLPDESANDEDNFGIFEVIEGDEYDCMDPANINIIHQN